MFCPKCGAENPNGAQFCTACGATILQAKQASTEAQPQKRPLPLIVAGVVVLAIVAAAAFGLMNVLGAGGSNEVEEKANAATLSYGALTFADGYDYFYSSQEQAICRAKPGGELERIVDAPSLPSSYILDIAVDGEHLFYVCSGSEMDETDTYISFAELRCVNIDGSDDHLLDRFESSGGAYSTPGTLYAYEGRAYLAVMESDSYGMGETRVMSYDAAGEDVRTECTLEAGYSQVVILPDTIYYLDQEYGYSNPDLGYVALYRCNLDGSDSERLYEADGCSINSYAVAGDTLVVDELNYARSEQRIMTIDLATGDTASIYRPDAGYGGSLLAISGDTVFVERYDSTSYGEDPWNIIAVSLESGEETEFATGIDYLNPYGAVMNGHLLITENGLDVASLGSRAMVLSLEDGSVVEEYVS